MSRKKVAPALKLGNNEAADVACLVGEMHLSKGEYHKAIEAFTRALEENPTADVYEGRARAYRLLADADDVAAQRMRGRGRSKKSGEHA
jgi:tetratricopeptide (TPR) repeat protein